MGRDLVHRALYQHSRGCMFRVSPPTDVIRRYRPDGDGAGATGRVIPPEVIPDVRHPGEVGMALPVLKLCSYMRAGASMPSRSSPVASTSRVTRHRASRLDRDGSSAFNTGQFS